MVVLMWARADKCEFFTWNWLSVCLFSLRRFVWFDFEAACCMNCNKGGIFLSAFVWCFQCLQPVFSYIRETHILQSMCHLLHGLCVHGRHDRKKCRRWRKLLSRSTSEDSNKLYLSSLHDSEPQTHHRTAEIAKIWRQDNNSSNHWAHSHENITFLLM